MLAARVEAVMQMVSSPYDVADELIDHFKSR
jgi:hypothetical protein